MVAATLSPPSAFSRAKSVLAQRRERTAEEAKAKATLADNLYTAQERCHLRADGAALSGLTFAKMKARAVALLTELDPHATTEAATAAFDDIGKKDSHWPSLSAYVDTVTGRMSTVWTSVGSTEPDEEAACHAALTVAGIEEEKTTRYTASARDAAEDRFSDMLAVLYDEAGEPGEYDSYCLSRMCRTVIRGYQRLQSFDVLLAETTGLSIPDTMTILFGLKAMDSESPDMSYMQMIERWLPEVVGIAVSLLTTYADVVRSQKAAEVIRATDAIAKYQKAIPLIPEGKYRDGVSAVLEMEKAYLAEAMTPLRDMGSAEPVPSRRTPVEEVAERIINAYAAVPDTRAVGKAFTKDVNTVTALLKERGYLKKHGGGRKKAAY